MWITKKQRIPAVNTSFSQYCLNRILEFGQISHNTYKECERLKWSVKSDCEVVHIISTSYVTTAVTDHTYTPYMGISLRIDGIIHHDARRVSQIVSGNFTVFYDSTEMDERDGFTLNWSCAQLSWTEWTRALDGSCTQQRKLENNGTAVTTFGMSVEDQKPIRELNGSCGKHN